VKYILGLLLLLAVVIISVTLGANNQDSVTFNYLLAKGTYPLPVLLAVFFGSGLIIGWLLSGIFYLRLRWRLARSESKLKKSQKKVQAVQSTESSITVPALPNNR
jgi:putative membrane protein